MKTKRFVFYLLLGIIYMSCDDTIGTVGLGTQPDEDKISVFDTTVVIEARTIEVDSIYAKTNNSLLGEFYDPTYGNIKSSYMCQYYPSIGFSRLDSIAIDSVRLNVYYYLYSILGDTLAPMEVSVFRVVKPLEKHYYTNADPKGYCDMNRPIAKYAFTARNYNMADSALQASGYYRISIPLPVEIGQDYLNGVTEDKINTVEDFLAFFPGTYLTTTYGTGCMLPVDMTEITVHYSHETHLKDMNGNDSMAIVRDFAAFTATKEIIQLNKFENKNSAFLTQDDSTKTYIKSPAGVFTELTIPIKEIIKGIGKKKFSSVALSLKAYPKDDWAYSLSFPGLPPTSTSSSTSGSKAKMLLIEPDSVTNFFETKKIADGQTSYTTQFTSSTYSYDFSNIANVVQNAIDKAPDKDLKLWLIPVQTTWYSDSYGRELDYMTSHYLYPSGVTLKRGKDNLLVRVIATDLTINN